MDQGIYPVPNHWANEALVDAARYRQMYARSITDPDGFWAEEAQRLDWMRPFSQVKATSFSAEDFGISWFADGTLNLSLEDVPASYQHNSAPRLPSLS